MLCTNCGKEIPDGSAFCTFCGAQLSVPATETAEAAPAAAEPAPQPEQTPVTENTEKKAPKKEKKQKKEKKPRKKGKKGLVVLFSILAVLLAGCIALGCLLFPLEVSVAKQNSATTNTGTLKELTLDVTSNQPITEVRYAVEPEDADDLSLYTEAEIDGDMFKKTLTIENLHIAPGKVKLRLYIKTWFGEHWTSIDLVCNIGSIRTPSAEDIIPLYYYSDSDTTYKIVKEELMISFADGVSKKNAEKLIEEYGGEVVGAIYPVNMYQVCFEGASTDDLAEKINDLSEEEDVAFVTYNSVYENVSFTAIPNDSSYDSWDTAEPGGNNWHLECIDAPGAWEYKDKLSVVDMGVLDSTVYHDHEDLKINSDRIHYLPTDDFEDIDAANEALADHICVYDEYNSCRYCGFNDHGTHVAGIMGAVTNNNLGVAGTNWKARLHFANAWIYYGETGSRMDDYCSLANLYHSITHMAMSNCRVINMSLGCYSPYRNEAWEASDGEIFDSLVTKLEDAGYDFLIVKAAGNDGEDASTDYLTRILTYGETARKHVIVVGAISYPMGLTSSGASPSQYNMAWFSNYGDLVDIVAPGVNVYSTMPSGYDYMSGTSMAAPVVSGVAGMVYGANPSLTSEEVKEILTTCVSMNCPYNKETYPIVNARLAVERALGLLDDEDIPEVPEAGYITGLVQDAATLDILENAAVRIVNNETNVSYTATLLENGTYYLYAEPGTYTMYFSAPDYIDEVIYNVSVTVGVETYNVLLNMVPKADEDDPQTGTASGRVVDAFDANSIPDARIDVYRGISNKDGDLVTTVYADSYGYYSLELEPGNYTLRTYADGYTPASSNIIIIAGTYKDNQNCALTPILNEGEIRVVLTWGRYPNDLDSHIVGPYPSGSRFHVYYSSKNAYYGSQTYVNLDVDDVDSYGPETTSVYMGVPGGTYTFYVHDFSNHNSSYSTSLSTSGATVKVYVGGTEEPYIFNAPTMEGTLWTVFSITDGVLTPINEMSYHNSPSSIGS